jgi:hypothetical protein
MENKVKRPLSVWIAQIFLVILVVLFLLAFLLALMMSFQPGISLVGILGTAIIDLVIVTLLVAAFWGMATRRAFGRWLTVGMLSLIFVIVLLAQIFQPEGPFQRYEYNNSAEILGATIAQVTMIGLFLFLIFRLSFAQSVSVFFAKNNDAKVPNPPSSPPLFDA